MQRTKEHLPMDIGSSEAAAALADVRARHDQVVDHVSVPNWYWSAVAVAMVGLGAGVDTHQAVARDAAIAGFVVVVLGATAAVVVPKARRASWRNDLLGPLGAGAIVGFVWLVVGISLGLAFGLRAAHITYPATIGCAAGGLVMALGGPVLMGRLRRLMRTRAWSGDGHPAL
jgi:hypothetical protein